MFEQYRVHASVLLLASGVVLASGCSGASPDGALTDTPSGASNDVASVSQAISYGVHGFAWAGVGSGSYTPSSSYSYSSTGGSITVTQTGIGLSRVDFGSMSSSGGNAQVVSYGSGNARCEVSGWGNSGSSLSVFVACHTPKGAPTNAPFVVSFNAPNGGNDGAGAFLWASQASASSYTPAASWSWNSTGQTNTVQRRGTGQYTAILPGLTATGGAAQVTAYGSAGEYCKVQAWGPVGAGQNVYVLCFNATGAPADALFSLDYDAPKEVGVYNEGAYLWADPNSSTSGYPNSTYSYNSGISSGITAINATGRNATGDYVLLHHALPATGSAVLVGAYGSDSSYCKVSYWNDIPVGVQVHTLCFNASGAPVDTQYVEKYITKAKLVSGAGNLGQPCKTGDVCNSGLVCNAYHQCFAQVGFGQNCTNDRFTECKSGSLTCDNQVCTCGELGNPCCSGTTACNASLHCDSNVYQCRPPQGGLNQECYSNGTCNSGYVCNTSVTYGICVASSSMPKPSGDVWDATCYCDNGVTYGTATIQACLTPNSNNASQVGFLCGAINPGNTSPAYTCSWIGSQLVQSGACTPAPGFQYVNFQ